MLNSNTKHRQWMLQRYLSSQYHLTSIDWVWTMSEHQCTHMLRIFLHTLQYGKLTRLAFMLLPATIELIKNTRNKPKSINFLIHTQPPAHGRQEEGNEIQPCCHPATMGKVTNNSYWLEDYPLHLWLAAKNDIQWRYTKNTKITTHGSQLIKRQPDR